MQFLIIPTTQHACTIMYESLTYLANVNHLAHVVEPETTISSTEVFVCTIYCVAILLCSHYKKDNVGLGMSYIL